MYISLSELSPYLAFAVPPLLGAFIGYLTNRVAIRMLFRPLKQCKIGSLRIPMTPGVIPSKRHDLAINIGEMVGEHLLTSEEINNSLKKEVFQEHLFNLIESKVGSFLKKDLGALPSLIPPTYKNYFDIGYKTTIYQVKDAIHRHLQSDRCRIAIEEAIDAWLDSLLNRELNEFIDANDRTIIYRFFEENIARMFSSPAMDSWIEEFIKTRLHEVLEKEETLKDLFPESLNDFIIETIRNQTPHLLEKGAEIVREPEIRDKLVAAICKAIEEFVATLGPMAAMVSGFLNMDTVDEKIRHYFSEKEGEIAAWLNNDEVKTRVSATLAERASVMMQTPIAQLAKNFDDGQMDTFAEETARQISALLKQPRTAQVLSIMLRDNIETHLAEGNRATGALLEELLTSEGLDTLRVWLKSEVVSLSRSQNNRQALDRIIDSLCAELLQKPIGRLADLIPGGVRDGLYRSLQEMATNMLTSEVPGIVKSLNISRIVSERIDTFDLLRLERLLLSIMEDQFKYINLFGGLLGFLIGCANLVLLLIA